MYKIEILDRRAFRGVTTGHDPECDFFLGPYQLISEIIEHVQGPDFQIDGDLIYWLHSDGPVAQITND